MNYTAEGHRERYRPVPLFMEGYRPVQGGVQGYKPGQGYRPCSGRGTEGTTLYGGEGVYRPAQGYRLVQGCRPIQGGVHGYKPWGRGGGGGTGLYREG